MGLPKLTNEGEVALISSRDVDNCHDLNVWGEESIFLSLTARLLGMDLFRRIYSGVVDEIKAIIFKFTFWKQQVLLERELPFAKQYSILKMMLWNLAGLLCGLLSTPYCPGASYKRRWKLTRGICQQLKFELVEIFKPQIY
jgi:hypothetical protein